MEYRSMLNKIALDRLTPQVFYPDFKLGIGETESKESRAVEVQKNMSRSRQKATAPRAGSAPFELTAIDGQGEKISIENFPNTAFYIGNAIEGV